MKCLRNYSELQKAVKRARLSSQMIKDASLTWILIGLHTFGSRNIRYIEKYYVLDEVLATNLRQRQRGNRKQTM